MNVFEERLAKMAAERATWHDRYQTVRDAEALGFWPDAYGAVGRFGEAIFARPTKFGYPRGGVAHPMHVDGHGAGALLGVWTHAEASPDELRARPCWLSGIWTYGHYHLPGFRSPGALTFDEALSRCVALADYNLAHFIVPMWVGGDNHPCLKAEWWRDLLTIPGARKQVQLSLFGDEESPDSQTVLQRAIHALLDPTLPDAIWQTIEGLDRIHLEVAIHRVNRLRAEQDVPALEDAA